MGSTDHTVSSFDSDLKQLAAIVSDMGVRVARAVQFSAMALNKGDTEIAQQIIAADGAIDDLQHGLEERAIGMIARRQPVASDLREIIAVVRIANDLERIGDLSKNIAKRTLAIAGDGALPAATASLQKLSDRVSAQLASVMTSYRNRDDNLALSVWKSDHEIDALHTSLFRELLTYMMENPRNIGSCAHLLFCAKNLERIGDHATNIAETIHYMTKGEYIAADRPRADDSSALSSNLPLPPWKG